MTAIWLKYQNSDLDIFPVKFWSGSSHPSSAYDARKPGIYNEKSLVKLNIMDQIHEQRLKKLKILS